MQSKSLEVNISAGMELDFNNVSPNNQQQELVSWADISSDNVPDIYDTTIENNTSLGYTNDILQQFVRNPQQNNTGNRKRKLHKCCIMIEANNNLRYIQFYNDGSAEWTILCQNPFSNIYRLVNYTENKMSSFIIVTYNTSRIGLSIINESKLYKSGILDTLKADSMVNIDVEGVQKDKLISAISEFLQNEANKKEEVFLYPMSGWILDKKKFYTLNNKEALFFKLQKEFPKLPVFKRTLKQDNLVLITPHFKGARQAVYSLAFYGSILMTLLQNAGGDTGFAIWIPNNSKGRKFVDVFFRIWENYQSEIDISQKRQIKEIVNEAKDEPVIIRFDDNRQDSRRNIKNLLNDFLNGVDCISIGKIRGIPIIISDNFFQLRELIDIPERIFPLIPNTDEEFTMQHTSADTASKFISWCIKNYDFVINILDKYINGKYKDIILSSLEKTFFAIQMVVNIFINANDAIEIEQDFDKEYIKDISQILFYLKDSLKKFYEKTKSEMFRQWLSECLIKNELTLKNNNDVTESELDGKVVVYGNSGEMYFDDKAFETVLKKGEMADYDFMLRALAEQGAIQTEAKSNGFVTYKVKCAVPSGCGRNQKRLIKFNVGVLMDREGAEFDGELLQNEISDEMLENSCYLKIGTRYNGKKLKYDLYGENNTNAMVLVTGVSGSGKTNFSYNVIRQALKQNIIILVPDYSDSFETSKFFEFKCNVFSAENFPVSPFSKMALDEDNETAARRCVDLLKSVFNMGSKQKVLMERIVRQLLEQGLPITFSTIAAKINESEEDEFESIYWLDIYSKFNAFEKSKKSWTDIYNCSPGLYIIKFDGMYIRQDQIKCTELILMSLFEWLRVQGQEKCNKKIQIHLDEAQDLIYSEKSSLALLMRQGRKFGLSVFLYTQSLFTFSADVKEILMQSALLVNFKQTPNKAKQLSKLLEDDEKEAKDIEKQLKCLKKGEAFARGYFLKENGMQTNLINVKVQTPLAE